MLLSSYISLLWAGLLLGTSFVATPAKFLATSLTLAQALAVGKVTFWVVSWVEYALLLALSLSLLQLMFKPSLMLVFALIIALLLTQQTLLLPALGIRTDLVVQGLQPGPSNLHVFYIGTEFLKICALIYFASMVQKAQVGQELTDDTLNSMNVTNRF